MVKIKYILYTLILFIIVIFNVKAKSPTGIYLDNGVQTVKQDLMTIEERNEVEKEILNMFGVPKKPRKSPKNLEGSAPQFLFDVYRSIQQDGSLNRKTRSVSDIGLYDDRTVQDSDVILTLYLSTHSPISNVRHEHGKRILFELNDIPTEETHIVTSAEIHLYQSGNFSDGKIFAVTLYQVLIKDNGEKALRFVDTQNTTSDYSGWLRFNVTGALISWTHYLYPNRGLYVSVHSFDKEDHEIKPEDVGMVTWADKHQLSEAKKPFMVVYLKAINGGNIVGGLSFQKQYRRHRRKTFESSYNSNPFQNFADGFQSKSCQIQTLYVSFRDLEWQDWIIAPDGYGAFYCTGECNFPLNAHMNATNHAIVQTLVHLMSPLQVPKPCCAPTKMAQQAVLFFLEDNNVILKKYKNMIVKSCGCH
ncbi:protein 60A [Daktulosphaira vitifoliae]|uniref:protein 60A n=1 Tax=Daktulosphaira vitifoliae TaxID=58002 RepID=UPI0021A9B3EF|nr:protein 60A [Daktulosphaira vitifoliae]